jgi:protein TonB
VLPEVIAALPEPKPILEEEPEPRPVKKAEPRPERKKPARKPPPKAEVAQKVQEAKVAKAAPSERSAKSNAAKAPTISPAKWQSRVIAWINRHKRYPSASKARGDEGRVQVNFAINAAGVVISASIGRSSGDAALDQAALDMVRRASPVPAPPPEIARSRIQLALPVQFSLR